MRGPPIPQRIPPLRWRRPAFIWTPIALALSIAWPAALFYDDAGPQRLAIVSMLLVFALALASLGASWLLGRAPKSRRIVVLHVVLAGAVTAFMAPFALTGLLAALARSDAGTNEPLALATATTPLVLIFGLPLVLVSGIVFAWVALERPSTSESDELYHHGVQPFR